MHRIFIWNFILVSRNFIYFFLYERYCVSFNSRDKIAGENGVESADMTISAEQSNRGMYSLRLVQTRFYKSVHKSRCTL